MTLTAEIEALRGRKEGWNGYDALPPDPLAIDAAIAWLPEWWVEDEEYRCPGERPHVTSSAEGEVVFEWWKDEKKLTVYVRPMTLREWGPSLDATYVQSWGADMASEMEVGEISSQGKWMSLWNWMNFCGDEE